MNDDVDALTRINQALNAAEDAGSREPFDHTLTKSFAFRRASGDMVDRTAFLAALSKSGPRRLSIRSITLLGRDRAVVTCVVTMAVNGADADFDNLRLFVRQNGEWKLMAWANEKI